MLSLCSKWLFVHNIAHTSIERWLNTCMHEAICIQQFLVQYRITAWTHECTTKASAHNKWISSNMCNWFMLCDHDQCIRLWFGFIASSRENTGFGVYACVQYAHSCKIIRLPHQSLAQLNVTRDTGRMQHAFVYGRFCHMTCKLSDKNFPVLVRTNDIFSRVRSFACTS